jgi:membrane-associated protease RseP (regulator of RpoE activity)
MTFTACRVLTTALFAACPLQANPGLPQKQSGEPKQAFLGVRLGEVLPAVRAQLDLPDQAGLSLEYVEAGSPAAQAGLQQYDVLLRFNGVVVMAPEQIRQLLSKQAPLAKVDLTYLRKCQTVTVSAVLGEISAGELEGRQSPTTSMSCADGSMVELQQEGGGYSVRIMCGKGNTIYRGPFNTTEERAKVPEPWPDRINFLINGRSATR